MECLAIARVVSTNLGGPGTKTDNRDPGRVTSEGAGAGVDKSPGERTFSVGKVYAMNGELHCCYL